MKEESKEIEKNRFYIPEKNLLTEIENLYKKQLKEWKLFKKNIDLFLKNLKYKTIKVGEFQFKIQLNPGRKKNILEDVSEKAIKRRKCFLCKGNLPNEEMGIIYKKNYLILVNPFPILKKHFVLSHIKHTPQEIKEHIEVFFSLFSEIKEKFFLIFNGAKCGASAPDHFHLQFCDLNELTIRNLYSKFKPSKKVEIVERYPIDHISISSEEVDEIKEKFTEILNLYPELQFKINLILFKNGDLNHLLIFVRKKHRPSFYYKSEPERILISPGAIDLSGTFIIPEKRQFEMVNEKILKKIIDEITVRGDKLREMV